MCRSENLTAIVAKIKVLESVERVKAKKENDAFKNSL